MKAKSNLHNSVYILRLALVFALFLINEVVFAQIYGLKFQSPDVVLDKRTGLNLSPFKFADGSPAYVFSSYDEITVDLHFKWMKEYRIDGVFMQRLFEVLTNPKRIKHNDKVLASALKAANKYGVAICLMYDVGSMDDSKYKLIFDEWKHLVNDLKLTNQGDKTTYLFHNSKPLVASWGISAGTRASGHIPEISDKIPRNKGEFYWKKIAGAIESGADILYVAMFD
jgi:hypothetical protein